MHTRATKGEERSWSAQNAFRANAEDMMKNRGSIVTDISRSLDMLLTMMPVGYFQRDEEILGRLFNLAARGYPAHGQIPQNAAEGQAFLLDMGVKAPEDVRIYFDRKDFSAMREIFYRHDSGTMGLWFPPTAEINIGINSFRNRAVLEMYWKDAFPVMLGEMHRLLGDSKGLERFGFDGGNKDMKGIPNPLRPAAEEEAAAATGTPGNGPA
jgi:hypothetical protein